MAAGSQTLKSPSCLSMTRTSGAGPLVAFARFGLDGELGERRVGTFHVERVQVESGRGKHNRLIGGVASLLAVGV